MYIYISSPSLVHRGGDFKELIIITTTDIAQRYRQATQIQTSIYHIVSHYIIYIYILLSHYTTETGKKELTHKLLLFIIIILTNCCSSSSKIYILKKKRK